MTGVRRQVCERLLDLRIERGWPEDHLLLREVCLSEAQEFQSGICQTCEWWYPRDEPKVVDGFEGLELS